MCYVNPRYCLNIFLTHVHFNDSCGCVSLTFIFPNIHAVTNGTHIKSLILAKMITLEN